MKTWNMLLLIISIWLFSSAFSGNLQPTDNPLKGLPFTDPEQIFPMEQEWRDQPIVYDARNQDADFVVSLDQHLYPALLPIIQKFAGERGLKINVYEGTCGISAGVLLNKSVDMTGFCCPPGENDRLPGIEYHTLGLAPLHIITHPSNPLDNLTLAQVRDIFRGKITSWTPLTSSTPNFRADATIRPIIRLHCKNRPGHWRLLLDNADLFGPMVLEIGTIRDMISQVHSNPQAIGYEVHFHIQKLDSEFKVKSLNINGFNPHVAKNTINLDYPLYRTMNISTWTEGSHNNEIKKQLLETIKTNVAALDPKYQIIPAAEIRKAGWKFKGDEVVGEPR